MFHAFILRSEMFRTGGETFYAEFNLNRILVQVVDADSDFILSADW